MLCALPVAAGILLITLRANWPTLPLGIALLCVMSTWVGLALALAPGAMFATQPREFLWVAWVGLGLLPLLLFVRVLELPGRGILTMPVAYRVVAAALVFALVWTAGWLRLYQHRHGHPLAAAKVLLASTTEAYLVLPLVHYWLFTPAEYRYISTASNFFAISPAVQLLTYVMVLLVLALAYLPLRWRISDPRTRRAAPS
jgi:hypothetical protein